MAASSATGSADARSRDPARVCSSRHTYDACQRDLPVGVVTPSPVSVSAMARIEMPPWRICTTRSRVSSGHARGRPPLTTDPDGS